MPGRLWAVVSLLTWVAESVFNVLGSILVKQEKIVKLWHFCLFIKMYKIQSSWACSESSEASFYVYSSKLCSAATLPQKPTSLFCCQGQIQVLLRLYKNICCLTLPCEQPAICTDTFTHTLPKTVQHTEEILKHNIDIFCDILQLPLAVERTTYLLQMS